MIPVDRDTVRAAEVSEMFAELQPRMWGVDLALRLRDLQRWKLERLGKGPRNPRASQPALRSRRAPDRRWQRRRVRALAGAAKGLSPSFRTSLKRACRGAPSPSCPRISPVGRPPHLEERARKISAAYWARRERAGAAA